MRKSIKKNSSELKIGETFSKSESGERIYSVVSQGPKYFGYVSFKNTFIHPHFDVWVKRPARTTLSEFEVGDSFKKTNSYRKYTITAVGLYHLLAVTEDGAEVTMERTAKVEEID